jgi:hypothetical protein
LQEEQIPANVNIGAAFGLNVIKAEAYTNLEFHTFAMPTAQW